MRKIHCGILLLAFITNTALGSEKDSSTRVLFIGNSYTYYHSMPQLFRSMAEHRFPGRQIEVKFVGWGGATLKQLRNDGRVSKEIRSGRWNYVVLQEQSMLGGEIIEDGKSYVRNPDQFFDFSEEFSESIQKHDAEPVFFMTWSRKEFPRQQRFFTYAYMHIAMKTKSKIAPVGMAWNKLRSMKMFDLYERDGSHPSVYGSYTAALVLFSVIFDTDPAGIPGRLEGYEILRGGKISDEKTILCDLTEDETRLIQNTVSNIFHQLKKSNGYLKVEKAVSDKKPSTFSKILDYISDSKNQFTVLIIIIVLIAVVKGGIFLFNK